MGNLFQTIIDALSEGYGRHDTPGWAYVLGIIISVIGSIKAKVLLKKRKARRTAKAEKLETKVLKARLFSEESGEEVEYNGLLTKKNDSYHLSIEKIQDGKAVDKANVVKDGIDDMAEYLRAETKFILADFKQ